MAQLATQSVAHFTAECLAQFAPERVAQFAAESVAGLARNPHSALEHKKLKLPEPSDVVRLCQEELSQGVQQRLVETSFGSMFITPVEGGEIFLPQVGNIGIDVGIDLLPRNVDTYVEAVEYLAEKKSNSVSPWLLIWSVSFWQDKHWLGDALIQHMKDVFSGSSFQKVYFLESMDGDGIFQANLTLHKIKGTEGA